jgi:fructose-1,6-bisphosphatase/inositol monophosphatase family enzyme
MQKITHDDIMHATPRFRLPCMKLIDIARQTSHDIILPAFRSDSLKVSEKTCVQDLVTEADVQAERQMTCQIAEVFPHAVIIGEESVAANPDLQEGLDAHELCVIIDPIDGTYNYAHGIATFGVAIAVLVRGVTVFGLLYDPIMDDVSYAFRGHGARKMPKGADALPIQVRTGQCGFIPLTTLASENVGAAMDFGHTMSPLKCLHCSVHEYRLICEGTASWALATKSAPWDHAAGHLIHTEAGGITRFADGEEYRASRTTGAIISAPNEETWLRLQKGFAHLI